MKMRATGLLVCALMALALSPHAAHAQGGATSSITGVVTDTSGGIIPGADVVAKNKATSFESRTVTTCGRSPGAFAIPATQRAAALTDAGVTPTPSSREASTKNIENTLNWIKGAHTLSIGGAVRRLTSGSRTNAGPVDELRHRHRRTPRRRCSRPPISPAPRTRRSPRRGTCTPCSPAGYRSIAGNARLNEDTNEYQYLGLGSSGAGCASSACSSRTWRHARP